MLVHSDNNRIPQKIVQIYFSPALKLDSVNNAFFGFTFSCVLIFFHADNGKSFPQTLDCIHTDKTMAVEMWSILFSVKGHFPQISPGLIYGDSREIKLDVEILTRSIRYVPLMISKDQSSFQPRVRT